MAVAVPPQTWVGRVGAGYDRLCSGYWSHDYWSLAPIHGLGCRAGSICGSSSISGPTHGADRAALLAPRRAHACRRGRPARAGPRLIWVPIAVPRHADARLAVPWRPIRQGLSTDWTAHLLIFAPIFLFGFALGGISACDGRRSRRYAAPARSSPLLAGASPVWVELAYPGLNARHGRDGARPPARRDGLGESRSNRDAERIPQPRSSLARDARRGGFPFYHRPPAGHRPGSILVNCRSASPLPLEFALLLAGTFAGFRSAFYLIGRE